MRVKAIIEFEVEKTLIQSADFRGREMDEQTTKAVWKAREDIFHQLVEDLKVAETITNYNEVMDNTSIKDYKFFLVPEEPLLFEL